MRFKADASLFLVALIWGSAFTVQRVAGQQNVVYWFNGVRFLLGALALLPLSVRSRGLLAVSRSQWLWMGMAGAVLFAAAALQQAGLQSTTAGNASFITSLYVVFVPLVLFVGWGERLRWHELAAVGLAAGGAYLISAGSRLEVQKGDALELLGAVFWALHFVILGKFVSRYDAVTFSMGHFAVCAVLNILAGFFWEQPPHSVPGAWVAAILYVGIFSVGMGYTLQVWAQKYSPPTDAALILSLEAVFGALFGFLLLGERLRWTQAMGCLLVSAGVLLIQLRKSKSEYNSPA